MSKKQFKKHILLNFTILKRSWKSHANTYKNKENIFYNSIFKCHSMYPSLSNKLSFEWKIIMFNIIMVE